eukprot:TRINITY_DN3999_c0_g2_i2.p1 TRINITY_DN3999_c0_g2~~TRINITY_DN3999_c0_g2_i2.p1  ORF type:complete len:312 (+),score=12.15 TRINITY_DN3999_c0_g2_i2:112-1047(+)
MGDFLSLYLYFNLVFTALYAILSYFWLRRMEYFPIKERSPKLLFLSTTSHIVINWLQFGYLYDLCQPKIQMTEGELLFFDLTYYASRKLVIWPCFFRCMRIYFAYKYRDQTQLENRGKNSFSKKIIVPLLRNEVALIIITTLSILLSTYTEVCVMERHVKISDTEIIAQGGPYNFSNIIINLIIEMMMLILSTFLLRNVDKSHNIAKELIGLGLVFNLFSMIPNFNDFYEESTCQWELFGGWILLARFTCVVAVTMIYPLIISTKGYLPLSDVSVIRSFSTFLNEKCCFKTFLLYLPVSYTHLTLPTIYSV